MTLYDNNGTTSYKLRELGDHDGTTYHKWRYAYDNDGTTNRLVHNSELVIFDNGKISGYTPVAYTRNGISAGNGYYIDWVSAAATISSYLEVKNTGQYPVNSEWYSTCGWIKITGIDTTNFTTCKFNYTISNNGSTGLQVLENGVQKWQRGSGSGTGSFAISPRASDTFEIRFWHAMYGSTGGYARITKVWFE